MGRENSGLTFWKAFEKEADGKGLISGFLKHPPSGLANMAAVHSAAVRRERPMRWAARGVLGAAGLGYLANKHDKDPDYNRRMQ